MTQATATDMAGGPADVRATTYNLDGVHNRLSTSGTVGGDVDETTGDYVMDPAACDDKAMNQYTATPLDQRTYDANGNLTGILGNDVAGNALDISCLYDCRNRMVEYKDKLTGVRNTYVYDALGRRIAKTVDADGVAGGPTTTRYFYGGEAQWQVVEERGAFSQTTATYVYGNYIDEVLQMQRCENGPPFCNSGSPVVDYYYHTDDLYNVMAVTDDAGQVVERYEYDDYGTPLYFLASDGTAHTSSAIANPFLFTGRRHDPETAWYHYRTRYMDPNAGRFTTRDTIGIWGDEADFGNGYTYVANNPQYYLDPSGTSAVAVVLPFAGGAAVADGPFPVGDAIGATVIAAAAVVDAVLRAIVKCR